MKEKSIIEIERIKKMKPGEVILFKQSSHEKLDDLIYLVPGSGIAHLPVTGVQFHGMLGVFDGMPGIYDSYPKANKKVEVDLNTEDYHGSAIIYEAYELALIKQHGLLVPFIHHPFTEAIDLENRAYIGPDEISAVLKEKCDGHFERFFADYIKAHRRV